jgi:predicted small lipoprotein YifL
MKRILIAAILVTLFTGCGLKWRLELPNVEPQDPNPPPRCTGDACGDVSIEQITGQGYVVKNGGAKKVDVKMTLGYGTVVAQKEIILAANKQNGPYAFCTMTLPYEAQFAGNNSVSPPSEAVIQSVVLDRDDITFGDTVRLSVTLNKPAPAGGFTVDFQAGSHDGSLSAFIDYPYGIWETTLVSGKAAFTTVIRTQRVQKTPMKVFINVSNAQAGTGCNEQQVILTMH